MEATNIVAGATAGFDSEFGTGNDTLITASDSPGILSNIAKIIVAGGFQTSENGFTYGFVAEKVSSVVVSGTAVALKPGPHNDFTPVGGQTNVNELVPNTKPVGTMEGAINFGAVSYTSFASDTLTLVDMTDGG